jgi:thiamine-monophosphate kinase
MKLNQMGEFGLIESIKRKIFSKDLRVLVNIGDDAAVIKSSPGKFLVFTTDTLVEKVHFDLRYFTFEEVGWKTMTANLSDIAAMGGLPKYSLVTLGLPEYIQAEDVLSMYRGMKKIGQKYGCKIIGGDTTSSPRNLFVTIALLGEVEPGSYVKRIGAQTGDLICVTGNLGESQGGLEYLKKYGRDNLLLVRKHLQPYPRILQARILIRSLKINSMIDISDGLSSELFHLTQENHLGGVVYENKLPLSLSCKKMASILNLSPVSLALSSGEEYELLFTIGKKELKKIDSIKKRVSLSVIGEVTEQIQGIRLVQLSGKTRELQKSGFVHF